ncbi:unnamed protein product, partial [Sphenostylis stenocarpa]
MKDEKWEATIIRFGCLDQPEAETRATEREELRLVTFIVATTTVVVPLPHCFVLLSHRTTARML